MTTYYTYKDQVPLGQGQSLGFTSGKGYYARTNAPPPPPPPPSGSPGSGSSSDGGSGGDTYTFTGPGTPPGKTSVQPKPAAKPSAHPPVIASSSAEETKLYEVIKKRELISVTDQPKPAAHKPPASAESIGRSASTGSQARKNTTAYPRPDQPAVRTFTGAIHGAPHVSQTNEARSKQAGTGQVRRPIILPFGDRLSQDRSVHQPKHANHTPATHHSANRQLQSASALWPPNVKGSVEHAVYELFPRSLSQRVPRYIFTGPKYGVEVTRGTISLSSHRVRITNFRVKGKNIVFTTSTGLRVTDPTLWGLVSSGLALQTGQGAILGEEQHLQHHGLKLGPLDSARVTTANFGSRSLGDRRGVADVEVLWVPGTTKEAGYHLIARTTLNLGDGASVEQTATIDIRYISAPKSLLPIDWGSTKHTAPPDAGASRPAISFSQVAASIVGRTEFISIDQEPPGGSADVPNWDEWQ